MARLMIGGGNYRVGEVALEEAARQQANALRQAQLFADIQARNQELSLKQEQMRQSERSSRSETAARMLGLRMQEGQHRDDLEYKRELMQNENQFRDRDFNARRDDAMWGRSRDDRDFGMREKDFGLREKDFGLREQDANWRAIDRQDGLKIREEELKAAREERAARLALTQEQKNELVRNRDLGRLKDAISIAKDRMDTTRDPMVFQSEKAKLENYRKQYETLLGVTPEAPPEQAIGVPVETMGLSGGDFETTSDGRMVPTRAAQDVIRQHGFNPAEMELKGEALFRTRGKGANVPGELDAETKAMQKAWKEKEDKIRRDEEYQRMKFDLDKDEYNARREQSLLTNEAKKRKTLFDEAQMYAESSSSDAYRNFALEKARNERLTPVETKALLELHPMVREQNLVENELAQISDPNEKINFLMTQMQSLSDPEGKRAKAWEQQNKVSAQSYYNYLKNRATSLQRALNARFGG